MRHTIQLTTKARAMRMQVDSLFQPVNGGTLSIEKYCTGKYTACILDRTLDVPEDVVAVWAEPRRDVHGKYFTLKCLTSRSN